MIRTTIYELEIPLGVFMKKIKSVIPKKNSIPVCTAVPFTILHGDNQAC